uniref:Putative secreted protein n=1 Tax=Anopheles darlingi TaxID=43151 RepID=A0A2M4DJ58_ANODA
MVAIFSSFFLSSIYWCQALGPLFCKLPFPFQSKTVDGRPTQRTTQHPGKPLSVAHLSVVFVLAVVDRAALEVPDQSNAAPPVAARSEQREVCTCYY